MSVDLAIIGGTGLYELVTLEQGRTLRIDTPFGMPSAELVHGIWHGRRVAFLARHGAGHSILPHQINYRANIHALWQQNPAAVVSVNAVGSMDDRCPPGAVALPDQLIDYTHGRERSFYGDLPEAPLHVDFTDPYDESLRQRLVEAADGAIAAVESLVYGATQGPRLETSAEISRMIHNGCGLVGMTGMPEAVLARELDLPYASLCVVANWAAGFQPDTGEITMDEVYAVLKDGMLGAMGVLERLLLHSFE